MPSIERMIDERIMNWKGSGRKRPCCHSPGGTEDNHENHQSDSQSPVRNLNPGHPEYESGVLIARPRRSVAEALAQQ
jgi:hypothetical protein